MSLSNNIGDLVVQGFGAGIILYVTCFSVSKLVHWSKKFFNIITK